MATTAAPFGFQPVAHLSGTPRPIRMPFGITSGLGSNIFKYQPIKLSSGLIVPVTATSDKIFGVFAGVEFTPTGGRPTVSPYWPSGQTYLSTEDMNVYFWPAWDPNTRFSCQATAAVAQASMGKEFNISAATAGSTATGLSAAAVDATPVSTSSQGQFFLAEFGTGVQDQYGGNDTYTDLIVGIAYPQVGNGFQTSI